MALERHWVPLDMVVEFKRGVYEMALTELSRYLPRYETRNSYLRHGPRSQDSDAQSQLDGLTPSLELPPGASFDPDPQGSMTGDPDEDIHAN